MECPPRRALISRKSIECPGLLTITKIVKRINSSKQSAIVISTNKLTVYRRNYSTVGHRKSCATRQGRSQRDNIQIRPLPSLGSTHKENMSWGGGGGRGAWSRHSLKELSKLGIIGKHFTRRLKCSNII